jgi:hypothetical protein
VSTEQLKGDRRSSLRVVQDLFKHNLIFKNEFHLPLGNYYSLSRYCLLPWLPHSGRHALRFSKPQKHRGPASYFFGGTRASRYLHHWKKDPAASEYNKRKRNCP